MRQNLVIVALSVVIIGGFFTYYLSQKPKKMSDSNLPVFNYDMSGMVAIEGEIITLAKVDSSPIKYAIRQTNGAPDIYIDSLYNILLDGLLERNKGIESIFVGHGKLTQIEQDSMHSTSEHMSDETASESIVTPKAGPKSFMLTDAEFYVKNDGIEALLDGMVELGEVDDRGYQEVKYKVPKGVGWWNANTVPGKFYLDTKSSSYANFLDMLKNPPSNFGGLRLEVSPILIVNGMNRGTLVSDDQILGRYVVVKIAFDIPGYL